MIYNLKSIKIYKEVQELQIINLNNIKEYDWVKKGWAELMKYKILLIQVL